MVFRQAKDGSKIALAGAHIVGVCRAQRNVIATDDLEAGPLRLVTVSPAPPTWGDGSTRYKVGSQPCDVRMN